jgi:hypothetical protein
MVEPLLTARDYEGFRALLNTRRIELRLNMLQLDELASLPSGYCSKLLSAPRAKGGCYQRNIGPESMGKILAALSVEISILPAQAGSHILRGDKASFPQVKALSLNVRKGGLIAYGKMNSMQRKRFAMAGAAASAKKRRALAKAKKRQRSKQDG